MGSWNAGTMEAQPGTAGCPAYRPRPNLVSKNVHRSSRHGPDFWNFLERVNVLGVINKRGASYLY